MKNSGDVAVAVVKDSGDWAVMGVKNPGDDKSNCPGFFTLLPEFFTQRPELFTQRPELFTLLPEFFTDLSRTVSRWTPELFTGYSHASPHIVPQCGKACAEQKVGTRAKVSLLFAVVALSFFLVSV